MMFVGEDSLGKTYFVRCLVTVDPVTKLPKEVQRFERQSAEHEWDLKSKTQFEYLTDDEMAAVMDR